MISVEDLTYRYPRTPAAVFERHSFAIETGRIFAILGPNGRGKTTLLKCLAGLVRPTAGHIAVAGSMGYVPQHFATPFAYSVRDIVVMGRARHVGLFGSPTQADRAVAERALAELGIARFAERPITALSGGERQMVMIARALASEPEIMVLDEPTSSLDFRNQAIVLATLRRLRETHCLTIVMTTHDPQHALEVADQALLMHGGTGYEVGSADTMLTEERLSALYGLPIRAAMVARGGRRTPTMVPMLGDGPRGTPDAARSVA
ncbi:MAG: ABC transporter ATP-binding protein [Azospirillaceae bacterium]